MRVLLRVGLPLLVAAVAVPACDGYQTTDTPICGDELLPQGDACVLWPSACGCAAGQRCGFNGTATVCEPPGTEGVNAPCANDSVCAEGTICDGTRCRQACFESLDCGSDSTVACLDLQDSQHNEVAAFCHRDCDPTSPRAPFDPRLETCLAGESCQPTFGQSDPSCVPKSGAGGAGASCVTGNDCAAGFGCIGSGSGSSNVCMQYCWVEVPASCSGSTTCQALSYPQATFSGGDSVVVLGRTLGVCQ
jgi:hypothetical protein